LRDADWGAEVGMERKSNEPCAGVAEEGGLDGWDEEGADQLRSRRSSMALQ
jgi:hypothetical protein